MTLREKIWTFFDVTEKMHRLDYSTGAVLYCVTWNGKPYQAGTPHDLVEAVITDTEEAE